ncbi:RNA-guided endonuclease TnpB family protein, partial [Streptomyces sp. NPDC001982]
MTTAAITEDAGHARYTFRVRLSNMTRRALEAEWDRCRWVWNECVAKSKAVYLHNKA